MESIEVSLPYSNRFVSDYLNKKSDMGTFFSYPNLNDEDYSKRKNELLERRFPREQLVKYLLTFNEKFTTSKSTVDNILKLKQTDSLVVIGGQQAGLLTGPLYTIHKVISIIQLAKKQEEKLGVPVIPVFWVAGEDHDYEEINHVNVNDSNRIKKVKVNQKQFKKQSMSSVKIDKEKCYQWIRDVFKDFGETKYSNEMMDRLFEKLNISDTYVDFFIHTLYMLFPESGLVVIDSGDETLRAIEAPFFKEIIAKNDQLRKKIVNKQKELLAVGYGEPVEINDSQAHLFYQLHHERVLLETDGMGAFVGKNNVCKFSYEELTELVEKQTHLFSNNVMTRPLMQEYLFPTLAFIAGPGEIAYWGILKEAFLLFGFQMPLVVPRLNITIVDRKSKKVMEELGITIEAVLSGGMGQLQEKFILSKQDFDLGKITEEVFQNIQIAHEPLRNIATISNPVLAELAQKNLEKIRQQIDFLAKQIDKDFKQKYEVELNKMDYLDGVIRPNGLLQERTWNVFYFVNSAGIEFIGQLTNINMEINGNHKVVFI